MERLIYGAHGGRSPAHDFTDRPRSFWRDINANINNGRTKPRGRRPGIEVEPSLVRQARLAAGLSMSQLAGADFTRQTIFLIEAGRARPSMRTLEIIAGRTGMPVQHFLRGSAASAASGDRGYADPRVEELQALCLQHQFDEAIALGLPLLERPMTAQIEARVRHYVGQAFVRSRRPDEGLVHLRRAQALLEIEPDPWLAIECTDWEASGLYLNEDPRALAVAERALKLCRATEPCLPGTEARILEHIATIHVKNHSFDRAIRFYEEALRAARTMRDLPRRGGTYHGLGIAYQERGDTGKAIEYTHKALALYALERDTALQANGQNELGILLMRQGRMERAEEAFRTALVHLVEAGTERMKSHVLLSLGELYLRNGRAADGIKIVKEAIELARRHNESMALASGHVLLGQLNERMDDHEMADKEFRVAIRLLGAAGRTDRLAETHAAYAEMLDARGDGPMASRQWKRAAKLALQRRSDAMPAKAV
ncbi:MAG: tetratricopeptide repeat protein [Candidatus Dormibacteraceae bacterium]